MRAFEHRKKSNATPSSFFGPKIQKKIKTGTVGDAYEVEADKVADKVVNNSSGSGLLQSKKEEEVQQKPISETISSVQTKEMKEEEPVQKKSDEKEEPVQKKEEEENPVQKKEKEEEPVQKKADEKEEPVQAKCDDCEKEEKVQSKSETSKTKKNNGSLETKLDRSKGSGNPMNTDIKQEMESGFGADFSKVNIHTDSTAVQMSDELGAQAFTHGNDLYFNNGKYDPNSKEGKHLLAHELTHTVQQTGMVQKSVVSGLNSSEDLQSENPNHQLKGVVKLEQVHDNQSYLSIGSSGYPVEQVQEGLTKLGFELPKYGVDGAFGNETKQAVLDFQETYDLTYDGIVGEQTIGVLDDVHSGNKAKIDKKDPSSSNCGETVKLPLSGSCYDYMSTCITETFIPDSSAALTISIDVDYMNPPDSWIKEDVSIQVMKCGTLDDTKIGSKRVSEGNIPVKMETKIASVTPGDKYYVIIFSRSNSRLKTYYKISQ